MQAIIVGARATGDEPQTKPIACKASSYKIIYSTNHVGACLQTIILAPDYEQLLWEPSPRAINLKPNPSLARQAPTKSSTARTM